MVTSERKYVTVQLAEVSCHAEFRDHESKTLIFLLDKLWRRLFRSHALRSQFESPVPQDLSLTPSGR